MNYSRNFGSLFPSESISVGTHKDVDDTVVNLVKLYNSYVGAGDMEGASRLYSENKDTLDPYILTMADINRLEEEVYNTGLYAMVSNTTVISDEMPEAEQNIGDYWLLDY